MHAEECGRKARDDAKDGLEKELKNGPRTRVDVGKAAEDKNITKAALPRAREELVGNPNERASPRFVQRLLFDKQHEDGLKDVQYD